jgi:nicotinamide-nucleotide amidase
MTCAVLCIGTEIVRGELVNANAAHLASSLTDLGFSVLEEIAVGDDIPAIVGTLERLANKVSVIVCTGELGPTTDDLTSEAVANALGVRLVRDEASLEAIRRRFEAFQRHGPGRAASIEAPRGRFFEVRDHVRRIELRAPAPTSRTPGAPARASSQRPP